MRRDEFQAVGLELLKTAELFGEAMGEGRVTVYLEALDDLDAAEVCGALAQLRRAARWFPKPGDIRDLVRGDTESRAHDAWLVLRAAETVKEFVAAIPTTDRDPALEALEACGGFRWVMADAPMKEVPYMYRQFVRAFMIGSRTETRKALQAATQSLTSGAPKAIAL